MSTALRSTSLFKQLRAVTSLPSHHRSFHTTSLKVSSIATQPLLFNNTVNTTSSHTRLSALSRQFATTTPATMSNNNDSFKLETVFNVTDKVALVTGGGSGIGLMVTQALAVNGAKVYIVGRTMEKLETVAKTYGQGIPGQIIPIVADVSKKDDIAKLYDQISSKESHLDILVNNAGISTKTFKTESSSAEEMKKNLFDNEDATFEDWNDVYRTNVSQIYFMSTCFLPLLQKATGKTHGWSGTVLNISSMSGEVKTMQHHPQYNASKAATIHLTKMLANEIQQNGLKIRVNSIAPGVFPSEMTAGESDEKQKSHVEKEKYEDKTSAQRPGNDKDMAGAVLFVVTNQYLNGKTVTVDGGYELVAGT